MALPPTHTLTIELSGIDGRPLQNYQVSVELVDPELVWPLGVPTETLFPTQLQKATGADGVVTFNLLPSTLVGDYKISIGSYSREITMPDMDIRLSEL